VQTKIESNIWSGFLFGLGLVSDRLFHAFSWFATIGGLFLYVDLRRKNKWNAFKWWGGLLFGAGFFQLYGGTIQHKILKLHEIRYVKVVFIYDFIWNLLASS
jgi:uncharacterized membrane protein